MNVRGWGFSCQIPLSLEQRVAVAVKLAPPQPAESRAKMLYPSSPSLLVAHASVLLQRCFCCSYFMRLPDAFFHFFFLILSMQQSQLPLRKVALMSDMLSPTAQQHRANHSLAPKTLPNKVLLHTGLLTSILKLLMDLK